MYGLICELNVYIGFRTVVFEEVYLSLPRYGVLKHEMCALLADIITMGQEQEVLVGVIGQRWRRCGGH